MDLPRMGSEDAFFVYVDSARVRQEVGALIVVDPHGPPLCAEDVHRGLQRALAAAPWLGWRLQRRPGRRPRWLPGGLAAGLPVEELSGPGPLLAQADRFFAAPLRPEATPWRLAVVTGPQPGILLKVHHAAGDGLTVLDTFGAIATAAPTPVGRPHSSGSPAAADHGGGGPDRAARAVSPRLQAWKTAGRGLVSLAAAGRAPRCAISGPRSSAQPARHAFVPLPDPALRRAARAYGCGASDLLLAVVAEAMHEFLRAHDALPTGGLLRVMVPRMVRSGAGAHRPRGNHTAASSVALPVGALTPRARVRATAEASRGSVARGEPQAAYAVMRLAGLLPAPLHARAARAVYRSRWFTMIVSVIPGPRAPRYVGAARVREVYPVLPLAEGVGVAVGVLAWDQVLGATVTWDPELVPDGAELAGRLRAAFTALAGEAAVADAASGAGR